MSLRKFRPQKSRAPIARLAVHPLESRIQPAASAYSPADVLVRFETGTGPATALPVGDTVEQQLGLVPGLYVVAVPAGSTVDATVAALAATPGVLYAQRDYTLSASEIPNDPTFPAQWDQNNTGQTGGTSGADIEAPAGWDMTTGTGSVTVAVIDSGIDYNHPDLHANMWVNTGEIPGNGIDDDHDGYVDDVYGYNFVANTGDPMDDNGHGTHVAGTIGAVGNNGVGIAGVDWNVKLMALKFLDSTGNGSTSNAISALNFAVSHGAKLSNDSWGGAGFSQALSDAITAARNAGDIFVAAAGNNAVNNNTTPFYPASYSQDNIVAVAATDKYDALANYSNYGPNSVDLAAPGTNIYSTLPNNSYGYMSGTSMAAPHVTGALALVWNQHPSWTYQQVITQVFSTVDPLSSLTGKVVTGGRLDLARAVGSGGGMARPSLAIGNVSLPEGNTGTTAFTFTVSLSAPSSQTVTVAYSSADGAATTADGDYQAASGTLSFAPGETSKTVTILVTGDTTYESDETFSLNLSGAANATISTATGTGTIQNDDPQPTLAIGNLSLAEGNSGTTAFTFSVSLSAASGQTVTVNYASADGAATTADGDYQAASGTLTFAPGETSKTVTILVNGDTRYEPDETFNVNLSRALELPSPPGSARGRS